jgi:hypothetical protein
MSKWRNVLSCFIAAKAISLCKALGNKLRIFTYYIVNVLLDFFYTLPLPS